MAAVVARRIGVFLIENALKMVGNDIYKLLTEHINDVVSTGSFNFW